MNYRELLKRYIRHVYEAEGSTFVPSFPGQYGVTGILSPNDTAELEKLETEAFADADRKAGAAL